MYETLIELKKRIAAVMPLLDANLAAARTEWMAGILARGAFEYCSTRHLTACHIVEAPPETLLEEPALLAGARLFIDLRSAMKDVPADRRAADEAKVEELRKFYAEQGFTAINPHFDIPMKPFQEAALA
jgi:hypothetical protein